MHALSMIISLYSMSEYSAATFAHGREEEAVGHLHDIGFVHAMNFLAPPLPRIFERESRHPRGRFFGDDLQALDDARHHLMLQPRVQVLGVFANDYQINVLESGFHALEIFHWPHVSVEVQRLPQAHIDAGRSRGDASRKWSLQRHAILANRFDELRLA